MNTYPEISLKSPYDVLEEKIRAGVFPFIIRDIHLENPMNSIHRALDNRGLRGMYRLFRDGDIIWVRRPKP